VEATLHTVDDALNPAANWVLVLRDIEDSLEEATSIKITIDDIKSIQDNVGKPFVSTLKANISSHFCSQDVVSAFSIFDPRKTPSVDSSHYKHYGEDSLGLLLDQYGVNKTALTVDGEEYEKKALITAEVHAEWTTFCHCLLKRPKEDTISQLNNLVTTDMLKTMFPHLNTLANVCITIPVGTASVERSFSQMKMIKTRLRNRMGENVFLT